MTSTMKIENGNKVWRNAKDQFHRTDGPAIERVDGYKKWWINGKRVTEDEFKRRTA